VSYKCFFNSKWRKYIFKIFVVMNQKQWLKLSMGDEHCKYYKHTKFCQNSMRGDPCWFDMKWPYCYCCTVLQKSGCSLCDNQSSVRDCLKDHAGVFWTACTQFSQLKLHCKLLWWVFFPYSVNLPLPYSLKSSMASATHFIEDGDSLVYPAVVSRVPPYKEIHLKWW